MSDVRTILVVDDDEDIREITRLSLELKGAEVYAADNGASAVQLATQFRPDAVLLDVMMPGMDGPATARKLQENPATRGIPVILLTAKSLIGPAQPWDDLPIAGVIAKPFDPISLKAQVDQLVAARVRLAG